MLLTAAPIVRENMKAPEEDRLSEEEVLGQMGYVSRALFVTRHPWLNLDRV